MVCKRASLSLTLGVIMGSACQQAGRSFTLGEPGQWLVSAPVVLLP